MDRDLARAILNLTAAIDRYTDELRRVADVSMASVKQLDELGQVVKELMKK